MSFNDIPSWTTGPNSSIFTELFLIVPFSVQIQNIFTELFLIVPFTKIAKKWLRSAEQKSQGPR